jgi:hypothetical protein
MSDPHTTGQIIEAAIKIHRKLGPGLEIKCKEAIHPVDEAQLLSYLRLLNLRVGLLINFHVLMLKDGIKRMVNNYHDVPWDRTLNAEYAEKS